MFIFTSTIIPTRRLAFLYRSLSCSQVTQFYFIANFIFVLPLLLNNYLYIDDTWRTLKADTGWQNEGRIGADIIINLLSLTSAEPNLFPLSLLVAVFFISLTLVRLAFFWFHRPNFINCLMLLPLWYNPFFIQLLSYQYDCLTATISISAMIIAITFSKKSTFSHFLAASLCIVAGLSIYQISLHIFIGLAGAYLLYQLSYRCSLKTLLRLFIFFVVSLIFGVLFYFLTFFQMITDHRGGLILPNWQDCLFRFTYYYTRIALFITPINTIIFLPLILISLVGIIHRGYINILYFKRIHNQLIKIILLIIALLLVILSLPGIGLLIADYKTNAGARILIGTGPLLVAILHFFQCGLQLVTYRLSGLIVLPLWVFLSFSFSYGSLMHQKQMNEMMLITLLVGDINQNKSLYQAKTIYIDNKTNKYNNLFPNNCTVYYTPGLDYVFESRYVVLSERLAMSGIYNTAPWAQDIPKTAMIFLVRKFWNIYVEGKNVWVTFNHIINPEKTCSY